MARKPHSKELNPTPSSYREHSMCCCCRCDQVSRNPRGYFCRKYRCEVSPLGVCLGFGLRHSKSISVLPEAKTPLFEGGRS